MDMLTIFEDSKESVISNIITKAYIEPNVRFTNGAKNLEVFLDKYTAIDKHVYCYVDVVPDNPKTVDTFISLKAKYVCSSHIHIIPIPCMEYFVLLSLLRFNKVTEEEISNLLYVKTGDSKYTMKCYSDKSFEKYCKRLLNNNKWKCVHNIAVKKGGIGYWWGSSCICDYSVSACKEEVYLFDKIAFVISEFPVFPDDMPRLGKAIDFTNYKKYDGKAAERFILLFRRMVEICKLNKEENNAN